MGARSHTSFGNDDASDCLYEVESDGAAAIEAAISALEQTPADGYIESSVASALLAVSELIAAAHCRPPQDFPDPAPKLAARLKPDGSLRARALAAVKRVANGSELRKVWEESDEFDEWLANVNGLIVRLQ